MIQHAVSFSALIVLQRKTFGRDQSVDSVFCNVFSVSMRSNTNHFNPQQIACLFFQCFGALPSSHSKRMLFGRSIEIATLIFLDNISGNLLNLLFAAV